MSRKNKIAKVLSLKELSNRQELFEAVLAVPAIAVPIPLVMASMIAVMSSSFSVFLSPVILFPELGLLGMVAPVFLLKRKVDKEITRAIAGTKEKEKKELPELKSRLRGQHGIDLTDDQALNLIQGESVEVSSENKIIRYEMVRNEQGIENLTVTESVKKNLPLSKSPQELAAGKEKPNAAKETVLPVGLFI